jgi:hypothetical protein
MSINWKFCLTRALCVLWGAQLIWLAWHFAPEALDIAWRIPTGEVGAAVHQEDPWYLWCASVSAVIPPDAAYVFVDNYEAGNDIEIGYYLAPRRHIRVSPKSPAAFLFHALDEEQAAYLIIMRDQPKPPGPGVQAALRSQALLPLQISGPGQAYRVDYQRFHWGFYD